MKRILILTILLMSSLAWAGSTTVVVGQGGGAPTGCTTCTGNYGETVNGTSIVATPGFTWVERTAFGCTAAAGDTTFNARVYNVSTSTRKIVYLIYADNEGEPGDLLWQSDPHYYADSGGTPVWKTDTVNVALSGDYLWIGTHYESENSNYLYTSDSPARTTRAITNAGTFPDVDSNWDTAGDTTSKYGQPTYLSY